MEKNVMVRYVRFGRRPVWGPVLVSFLFSCVLAGCTDVPVAQDLSQEQALEIVAALSDHGISSTAERGKGSKPTFTVNLSSQDYSNAVQLLREEQLPREQRPSVRELLTPSGLLPLSRELEMVKVDRATAGEVEELLLVHPGVEQAKVVVRAATVAGTDQPRSVSVVLTAREGINEDGIRSLVNRVISGVLPENISVMVEAVRGARFREGNAGQAGPSASAREMVRFLYFWKVPKSEVGSLTAAVCALVALVGLFAAVLGFVSGASRVPAQSSGEGSDRADGLDRISLPSAAVRSGRFLVEGPSGSGGGATRREPSGPVITGPAVTGAGPGGVTQTGGRDGERGQNNSGRGTQDR